ncbi:hypothetical protein Csa_021456 [Cucumis sativus]|uniref:Uncharacterized protein n=1 Tax=Cucumis sativus TaxID=3659 RepID=A0A0A0KLY7_CUCSA|nr:hypothetical protein Csa_021456 [Cucumis sativus]
MWAHGAEESSICIAFLGLINGIELFSGLMCLKSSRGSAPSLSVSVCILSVCLSDWKILSSSLFCFLFLFMYMVVGR